MFYQRPPFPYCCSCRRLLAMKSFTSAYPWWPKAESKSSPRTRSPTWVVVMKEPHDTFVASPSEHAAALLPANWDSGILWFSLATHSYSFTALSQSLSLPSLILDDVLLAHEDEHAHSRSAQLTLDELASVAHDALSSLGRIDELSAARGLGRSRPTRHHSRLAIILRALLTHDERIHSANFLRPLSTRWHLHSQTSSTCH
jgi:hypothetical protein